MQKKMISGINLSPGAYSYVEGVISLQLQFHKTVCPCLQQVKRQVQNQEQTQEVRLGDDMPDIGRVLGAWGQVLLRGKEWQTGAMHISGGVMAWVLYAPEDGGAVRWVDTWIPFQMKWDLPDTRYDGIIRAQCLLRGIDARSTSARRLMVRASVGAMGEAVLPGEFCQYVPEEVPEDVQLLKNTYPFRLLQEAGEKPFALEELLSLPAAAPKIGKLIRYELMPQILDQKVMGSKVVFRGTANLHMVYLTESGIVQSWDFELPFSQFAELDGDYDHDAEAALMPAVTGIEMEQDEEGNLHLKADLTGQYVINDRNMVTVVEDAYSPKREVAVHKEMQQVPVILEQQSQTLYARQDRQWDNVADMAFYPDHPRVQLQEGGAEIELPGQFAVLYYDGDGTLQGAAGGWEGSLSLSTGPEVQMEALITGVGKNQADQQAELRLALTGCAKQGIGMVTALELGEETQPDPNRPSLVLRRVGEEKLWDIAKQTGSTVSAIREANKLAEEPEKQQILLIPIS